MTRTQIKKHARKVHNMMPGERVSYMENFIGRKAFEVFEKESKANREAILSEVKILDDARDERERKKKLEQEARELADKREEEERNTPIVVNPPPESDG